MQRVQKYANTTRIILRLRKRNQNFEDINQKMETEDSEILEREYQNVGERCFKPKLPQKERFLDKMRYKMK